MDTELCKVDGCGRTVEAREMCHKHYQRWYKGKDILEPTTKDSRPAVLRGNVAHIPLGLGAKGGYATVDSSHIDLQEHKWSLGAYGYAKANVKGKGVVLMQSLIIGQTPANMLIDHINGNRLDNRESNLRFVTKQQNNTNRAGNARSSSKYRGVFFHKGSGKWAAKIGYDKKQISLGYYDNEEDAAGVYNNAAVLYHGEYARLNILDAGELK